jgi:hypothetical protein
VPGIDRHYESGDAAVNRVEPRKAPGCTRMVLSSRASRPLEVARRRRKGFVARTMAHGSDRLESGRLELLRAALGMLPAAWFAGILQFARHALDHSRAVRVTYVDALRKAGLPK